MFDDIIKALNGRGFIAKEFVCGKEVVQAMLHEIEPGTNVGVGGSMTINSLGLVEALEAKGCSVFRHMYQPKEQQLETQKHAFNAEVYLLSANAITESGILLNTDGIGNRLASSMYGRKRVYFIVGKNKIVKDLEAGLKRIHEVAAPLNAQRLKMKTPCGITGKCADCRTPQRICNVTAIHEGPTRLTETHVYLVDENLGY